MQDLADVGSLATLVHLFLRQEATSIMHNIICLPTRSSSYLKCCVFTLPYMYPRFL